MCTLGYTAGDDDDEDDVIRPSDSGRHQYFIMIIRTVFEYTPRSHIHNNIIIIAGGSQPGRKRKHDGYKSPWFIYTVYPIKVF